MAQLWGWTVEGACLMSHKWKPNSFGAHTLHTHCTEGASVALHAALYTLLCTTCGPANLIPPEHGLQLPQTGWRRQVGRL